MGSVRRTIEVGEVPDTTPASTREMRLSLARRALLAAALTNLSPVRRAFAIEPDITRRVRFGVTVGDAAQQYLTVGLYGDAAPSSVNTFCGLCSDALEPGLSYRGSIISRINAEGGYIIAGKLAGGEAGDVQRSIDRTGYVRSERVSKADRFVNGDSNFLRHDRAGLVSMKRGGGEFEFAITTRAAPALDADRIVVGEVVEGQGLLSDLAALPVRMPSAGSDLSGLASLYGLKAGVGLGVAGLIGRSPLGDMRGNIAFQVGRGLLGLGAAAFVGGDDPRVRSRELAYRPLMKVRIRSCDVAA